MCTRGLGQGIHKRIRTSECNSSFRRTKVRKKAAFTGRAMLKESMRFDFEYRAERNCSSCRIRRRSKKRKKEGITRHAKESLNDGTYSIKPS